MKMIRFTPMEPPGPPPAGTVRFFISLDGYPKVINSDGIISDFVGPPGTTEFSELVGIPSSFPPEAHTHAIGDVETLSTALSSKADLGDNGQVLSSQIPGVAIVSFLGYATSDAEMLQLVDEEENIGQRGDWCIRSDLECMFMIGGPDGSAIENWIRVQSPVSPVTSVNGQVGEVVLGKVNLGLGSVENLPLATQAEAEAGTSATAYSTPQRVMQAIVSKITGAFVKGLLELLTGTDRLLASAIQNVAALNPTTGQLAINAGIAATSATTGSLVVVGGVGINGDLFASIGSFSSTIQCGTNASLRVAGKIIMDSPSTGSLTLKNGSNNDFGMLQLGGVTALFPAIKRVSGELHARLADDSAFAVFRAGAIAATGNLSAAGIFAGASSLIGWSSRSNLQCNVTGVISSLNNAGTDFAPIQGKLRTDTNAAAGTITPTHTITLYDAAGTAYKVPCVAA